MAEFLIFKGKGADGKAPACKVAWERGDVVAVKPDGFWWGRGEVGGETFAVLRLIGVPLKAASKHCVPVTDPFGRVLRRSLWSYDFDGHRLLNKKDGFSVDVGFGEIA